MANIILGPIIGGLSYDKAFLWARMDGPGVLHVWLGKKPDLSDAYLAGRSLPLRPEDGFAGVAPITHLLPNSRYYYHLSQEDSLPQKKAGPLSGGIYPSFKTFPRPGELVSFNFAFGSCFRPKNDESGKIFQVLESRRPVDDLRFILLIGDQIYADEYRYNSLGKVACSIDEYRSVYRYTWSNPSFRRMFLNLPAFMTLDDHEVDDDWRWLDPLRKKVYLPWWNVIIRKLRNAKPEEYQASPKKVRNGLQAYWEHQGMHSPGFVLPPHLNEKGQYLLTSQDPGSLAYSFTFGGAAFFVLDTRTMRVRGTRPWASETDSMLGKKQWSSLETWLQRVKDNYPVKFIITSSALLYYLLFDIPRDRWSGFRHERRKLLSLLASQNIEGVYLLAGDLHSSHAICAELHGSTGKPISLWEFCSTPFEQKTNWLAKYLYFPVNDKPVRRQVRRFVVAKNNFGLVRVKFETNQKFQVRFEIYGENSELLAFAG
jgi:phosphodiesterase/alkaline phosphatase D-like protein